MSPNSSNSEGSPMGTGMAPQSEIEEGLKHEERVACTDCKSPNLIEKSKPSEETRIVRFVGVTDAISNKHRFPHEVMDQMVNDSKDRFVLPFMPTSVKSIDKQTLDVLSETKSFGPKGDPIPLRDMHDTSAQKTKLGRVLYIENKTKPDAKNGGVGRKWMEVVAEVFDPHMIKLIDRGMANKFSIGFKHRFDMVDGIKVSTYGVLDHFGFVDVPADAEAVMLEAKQEEDNMPGMQDCVQAKVADGMSQEEAEKACGEAAAKAEAFTPGGEPKAGEDRAFSDCVEGLVATGLDKDEAERACRDKAGHHADSDIDKTTPKTAPSGEPAMKMELKELYNRLERVERGSKAQSDLIQTLSAENKALKAESRDKSIRAEIKVLMEQGRVTPATKQRVYEFASALPDAKSREAYYDTLGVVVDFKEQGYVGEDEGHDHSLDTAAKEMWGSDIDTLISEIKGRGN